MQLNGKYEVCNRIIGEDSLQLEGYDLIISNPPWGKQNEGADSDFIEYILASKTITHIMHSAGAKHLQKRFEDMNWSVEMYGEADFPCLPHILTIRCPEGQQEQDSGG